MHLPLTEYYISRDFCHDPNRLLVLAWKLDFEIGHQKGLQKRVYMLIFSVSSFLPLRVLLLGVSVLIKPDQSLFQVLVLLAFFALFLLCLCTTQLQILWPWETYRT